MFVRESDKHGAKSNVWALFEEKKRDQRGGQRGVGRVMVALENPDDAFLQAGAAMERVGALRLELE